MTLDPREAAGDRAPEALWTLTWRHVTPKGVPGKVEFTTHLSEYELTQLLPKHLAHSCWVSIERQDINFRGKSIHKDAVRSNG